MNIDNVLRNKLGILRMALLKQGKVKQVLLMSNNLSMAEKARIMKYMEGK